MSAAGPSKSGRLIVALDFPDSAGARAMVTRLSGLPVTFKIGLELIYAGGLDLVRELIAEGHSIFLDAKLLDIPNTVERGVASATALGVTFLTVHGTDAKTLDAAVRGRGNGATKLLAITVLTSLDADDLRQQGIVGSPEEIVLRRARLAAEAGFDGVVASPKEAKAIRAALGSGPLIVTPGVRPAGSATADQARVATPADALRDGADHLVVGRPITGAADPLAAAKAILAEMDGVPA